MASAVNFQSKVSSAVSVFLIIRPHTSFRHTRCQSMGCVRDDRLIPTRGQVDSPFYRHMIVCYIGEAYSIRGCHGLTLAFFMSGWPTCYASDVKFEAFRESRRVNNPANRWFILLTGPKNEFQGPRHKTPDCIVIFNRGQHIAHALSQRCAAIAFVFPTWWFSALLEFNRRFMHWIAIQIHIMQSTVSVLALYSCPRSSLLTNTLSSLWLHTYHSCIYEDLSRLEPSTQRWADAFYSSSLVGETESYKLERQK